MTNVKSQLRWSRHFLLILVVIAAFALRVYRLDIVPPSLTWDEASVGYNALTIANYGKDEYGSKFPISFRSFGEYKQPIHIYITAFFVKLLGLSELSTRLPSAIFGTLNVLLIFYLAKALFNSSIIGLFSSLFLSFSPQHIFFSRFNHEANFALFFLMLGLLLFYYSLKRKDILPFSFLSFILSMISYNAAKIVVPPTIVLLIILFFKKIKIDKFSVSIISILLLGLVITTILKPQLLGLERYSQTVQGIGDIEQTTAFKYTNNYFLGRIHLALMQYSWHFDPNYLFLSGGKNPRLSIQDFGQFYKIDLILLLLGVIYILQKRSKVSILILSWGLLGPLPSSLFAEAPHVGRATFMMGSWNIISALGLYFVLSLFKRSAAKILILIVILLTLSASLYMFLNIYFNEFAKRYAIDWQYGMKQVVKYIDSNPQYSQVHVTDVRSQPYIFFLYYLRTPLPDYLRTRLPNNSESKSYSNTVLFDKFSFERLERVESYPQEGVLYVLSPSEYDGMTYKYMYDVKKIITYPNNTVAFYIVGAK